jgi:predicted nucleic acid-binding protein
MWREVHGLRGSEAESGPLVTLCDTGPLVALVDRDDPHHARCVAALQTLPAQPLLTTRPCLTEAMYLLWRAGGVPAQDKLRGYLADGLVVLHIPDATEWERIRTLMQQYHDAPMDLADASLVTAAERVQLRCIFTLDRHFYAYRIDGQHPFEVIP